MKRFITTSVVLVIVLASSVLVKSQSSSDKINSKEYYLYNTKVEYLTSESIADSFCIFISIPDGYKDNDKKYPVLYVLDGDIAYGMAASIARYLEVGGNIPELIIVGIGYGSIDKSSSNKRSRDYKPIATGGAENFLIFLKDELIPYVDSNYRTIPGDRTINGYSIGGLFALYTLFTQPKTFNRYIIGSPYLLWDDYSIYNYEKNSPEKIGDREINLFISVGSEESDEKYFNPIDELVTKIQERNYSGVILESKVFDGSTHLTGPPGVLTHGLISVFSK